jgi:EAL domain-containing protein (putative c-di-GMP-specific phosphodiesterase class I)/CheY-like chemotaxis protein
MMRERGPSRAKLCSVVERIRVMIAEDDPQVRTVLSDLVSEEDGLVLVGVAGDADEAIAVAENKHPDVALVDVKMPRGGGARAAQEIRVRAPGTRVVALSALDDRATVLEMLHSGAVSYLVKGASGEDILEAIRRSVRGQSSLSSEVTGDVIQELVGHLELRRHEAEKHRRRVAFMRRIAVGDGLDMVFQPIVHLASGRVVGKEALARFLATPNRPPDLWFAEAEEIGLRGDVELAAVRLALSRLETLDPELFLAVNISPDTVVAEPFLELLAGVQLDRVVFEISEHARVRDYDTLNRSVAELRSRGGRLAIDDAGAGFASLQHILRLSPDLIKLDMALTRGVDGDPARRALASALTSFAGEIGASIIAEGIETEAELEALRTLGIGYGQGFYLGEPRPG